MVILDTDLITLLGRKDSQASTRLTTRLNQLDDGEAATTVITYEEQMPGWLAFVAKSRAVLDEINAYRRLIAHVEFYRDIPVVPFDERAAIEFQRLRSLKLRIGSMDLKIASIAISRNCLLLTRNRSDFARVKGLAYEDWSA